VASFAILAAMGEALAERTMALWRELSPAPNTFFSKIATLPGLLPSLRWTDNAQATPKQPPPITKVWNLLFMTNSSLLNSKLIVSLTANG
jgi:hypothetical protein